MALTQKHLVEIVCSCLDDIGVMPDDAEEAGACKDLAPAELDLDDAAITQLLACVIKKVKKRGQTVVVGKTMWRRSKSVRHFCKALAENLE